MKIVAHFKNNAAIVHFLNDDQFCLKVQNNSAEAMYHHYYLSHERKLWRSTDPIFVSEALFAFANVLSFSRLSYILPISEFLGPLQISLGRMMGDIVRFGAVFTVVFLAFFCSFLNLYWFLGNDSDFGTFSNTLLTLFWSLFGMSESNAPDIENIHGQLNLTSSFGTVLFAIYHVVMNLVMLNMLIAMMSNSFQEIESEEDVEWKFARAKLWMSYVEKGATLPLPFNIIPSPKSFRRVYRWLCKPIEKHCSRKERHRRQENIHLANRRSDAVTIVTKNATTHVERTHHENMMKAIVKRYLFQLQRSKESDEVNEGELDEIKNDISSLRFELIELLNGDSESHQPSQSDRQSREDGPRGTATEEPQRGKRKPVTLKPRTSSLDEEDKKKLDHLEQKIDQLGHDMRKMQKEILKTLGRRSVAFTTEGDHLVV
ncbi:Short transient receptor potential channel 7 [Holothuria leucospilota]|uniref:Short transient receptor potential channel 7 n=1 Tax=Holothuria leucospilota TaxID=206669 RepID=A0A9Q0YEQ1_HOLLE|nr:Short transient receptor potential channel 7 [Holothuria leucospilota]